MPEQNAGGGAKRERQDGASNPVTLRDQVAAPRLAPR
jgi:hypothetical protein